MIKLKVNWVTRRLRCHPRRDGILIRKNKNASFFFFIDAAQTVTRSVAKSIQPPIENKIKLAKAKVAQARKFGKIIYETRRIDSRYV